MRACVPPTFSTVCFFFLLEGAVIPFFSSTVFVSSATGEVYICRSVFDNCVVHLGVFFKGIVKSNAKGVIIVSFLVFPLQAAFRLCRL